MKRTLSILLMLALMAGACVFAEGDQEAENYTRYFDYTPVENAPIGLVPGENHNTLVLYFSRVGNTAFPEEVDAVSYASQNVTEGEKLIGTAQMVAGWIADETGGDVFPIQTACTYPEAFWDTVTVIEGQEKDHVHPRMAAIPEDMTGYDTVWLVIPMLGALSVSISTAKMLDEVWSDVFRFEKQIALLILILIVVILFAIHRTFLKPTLECVSKCREMQFRVDLAASQGDFPQACWRQVKGNQRRNAGKDAENALPAF